MKAPTLPTFFISYGGGPWPWMMDELNGRYDRLAAALRQMVQLVGTTPKAVLMVSAYWAKQEFTLMSHPSPSMIYDYGGFPDYTHHIRYGAPGAPPLAEQVQGLLGDAGIAARLDPARGFDHGMYAPMRVIYPEAEVPTVQLSPRHGLDPAEHLVVGCALAPLRDEGVLIVGSSLSHHNLRMFGPAAKLPSAAFDAWLQQMLVASTPPQRVAALMDWEAAPAARQAHSREEHLLPLMVAVGAAQSEGATRIYHEDDFFGGISVSSFMFGASSRCAA